MFDLSKHPVLFQQPADLDISVPGWIAHIPFAFLLVDLLRPEKIVELGVHSGNSYLAFCQAVQTLGLSTQCFGVDTWTGDPQAGYYGASVYRDLLKKQEERYGSFADLLQMRFEQAVHHFEDGSIDLLHIDGLHTYEAVKTDFETWLPKLSRRGVVLIHDTHVRKDDFGVWQFWREISVQYPSFSFDFSNGLGVLLVGEQCPDEVRGLAKDIGGAPELKSFFHRLGKLVQQGRIMGTQPDLSRLERAQLFYDTGSGWIEQASFSKTVFQGANRLEFHLPEEAAGQKLRFDPATGACAVFIREVRMGKHSLLPEDSSDHNASFNFQGFFVFMADDPQIEIELPKGPGSTGTVEFDIQYLTFEPDLARKLGNLGQQIDEALEKNRRHITASETQLAENEAKLSQLGQEVEAHLTRIAALQEENSRISQQLSFRNEVLLRTRERTIELSKSFQSVVRKKEEVLQSLIEEMARERKYFREELAGKLARIQELDLALSEVRMTLEAAERTIQELETAKQTLDTAKQAVEAHNAEKQQTINGLQHQLQEERNVLTAFAEDNVRLREAIDELRSSWSFRIGWLLTWPLRFVHDLIFGGKARQNIRTVWRLLGMILLSPLAFLRHFRPSKIGVLIKALRKEPPQVILENFRNFLRYGGQPARSEPALPVRPAALPLPADYSDFEGPLISVVIPVYNTPERLLMECILSVVSQYYSHWELILIDDCSTEPHVRKMLDNLQLDEHKVKVIYSPENLNIAGITNLGIEAAAGDWIALLDHDDVLTPDALFRMARYIDRHPEVDVLYSDQDKINEHSTTYEPFYKPDWSPWFFRSVMYVGHLLVFRKEHWETVGRFNAAFNGIQDYEFMLRLSEETDQIAHLPQILYHWRAVPGSIAADEHSKGELADLQTTAVNEHLQRLGIQAKAVAADIPHRVRILPDPRTDFPKVSIIIPTKDSPELIGQCLQSIYDKTTYPNFEVLLVDNRTSDPDALHVYEQYPVKVIAYDEDFNFSRANNLGVEQAEGEYLVFLNNDVELLTPGWIEEFLFYAEQEHIGAVGPMLIFPNGAVQHAGVVLGFRGTADHVMRNFPPDADGYFGTLSCTREVSALTAACMMMSKPLFEELGGFNEVYAQIYQDVDLCLKIRERGLHLIYDPNVRLIHYESATRDAGKYDFLDRVLLLDQWQETIDKGDPFYNPNFNIEVYSETETGYHL